MEKHKFRRQVDLHLQEELFTCDEIRDFFNGLRSSGDVVLFGGAIRDIIDHITPRDYDLVIKEKQPGLLERVISSKDHRKNRFGGYSLTICSKKFDVWALDKTWAFENNLVPKNEENLVNTVFFNIDSVAINLSSDCCYIDNYVKTIKDGKLDIILKDNPFPALCVLRAFVFKKKKQLSFSKSVNDFIAEWLNQTDRPVDILWETQEKHYKAEFFTKSQLKNELISMLW